MRLTSFAHGACVRLTLRAHPIRQCHFRVALSAHSWWNKQSKKISLYQAKQSLTISPFKISELRLPFLSTGNNCSAGSLSEQQ
jgi:hypothetical protein